jgi:hypothetical protein
MTEVFISYHRAQRKLARLIAHRLGESGFAVWWDKTMNDGDAWSEATINALNRAQVVVAIWSRQALTSSWVRGEANSGFARKALVSIQGDGAAPPAPFDRAPAFDLSVWEGDPSDVHWTRAITRIRDCAIAAGRHANQDLIEAPPAGVAARSNAAIGGGNLAVVDEAPPRERPLPAPVRRYDVGPNLGPPPPETPQHRGGAGVLFATLLIAGAGAFWQRDRLQAAWSHWQETGEVSFASGAPASETLALPPALSVEDAAPFIMDTPLPPWEQVVVTPPMTFSPSRFERLDDDYLNRAAYGGGDPAGVRILRAPVEPVAAGAEISPITAPAEAAPPAPAPPIVVAPRALDLR